MPPCARTPLLSLVQTSAVHYVRCKMALVEAIQQGLPLEDIERVLAADPAAALVADDWGKLPVHQAAEQRRADVVRALLTVAPAAAAVAGSDLWTPLHWAAACGDFEAVCLLLEAAPATALALDVQGRSPLRLAACFACRNRPEEIAACIAAVAALLAAAPSTATLCGSDGPTPLQRTLRHCQSVEASRCLLLAQLPTCWQLWLLASPQHATRRRCCPSPQTWWPGGP